MSPAAASLPALAQPLNIQVDPLLQPLVDKLLRQSPTVRRQWQAIGASRLVRVSLVSSPLLRESSAARARTEVVAIRPRRHPRGGRAAERRRHHRAAAARARARPRTGRRTGSSGAGEGRLVGGAGSRRAGSTKRTAPGTPGSTRCGRCTARPTRRSRRPCAASSGRSRPCFPTDKSPPTRRPCPAPRPARGAARRFREAIQVISSSNRTRRLILFAYSPPVGDTRWVSARLNLLVVVIRVIPLGVVRRAMCG